MHATSELHCLVETPKGCRIGGATAVEGAGVWPGVCGYFPQTVSGRGRPLAAIVCVSRPGAPGGRIAVNPVALLRTRDRRGYDELVLCVALDDPEWGEVERMQDIPGLLREEIEQMVITRSARNEEATIVAWCSRDHALTAIDDAAAHWAETVNGRA